MTSRLTPLLQREVCHTPAPHYTAHCVTEKPGEAPAEECRGSHQGQRRPAWKETVTEDSLARSRAPPHPQTQCRPGILAPVCLSQPSPRLGPADAAPATWISGIRQRVAFSKASARAV